MKNIFLSIGKHILAFGTTLVTRMRARLLVLGWALLQWAHAQWHQLTSDAVAGIFFFVPLVLLPVLMFAGIAIVPVQSEIKLINQYESQAVIGDSAIELVAYKNYLQSQIKLSQKDSIGLTVNCIDSSIVMNLFGVPLRTGAISEYQLNGAMRYLKKRQSSDSLLSGIFKLRDHWATISKVPIKVVVAPSDSVEYEKKYTGPRKLAYDDVFCTLTFDKNVCLDLRQSEKFSSQSLYAIAMYHSRVRMGRIGEALVALIQFKAPPVWFTIQIELPKEDIKAIYRALPTNAGMALRI